MKLLTIRRDDTFLQREEKFSLFLRKSKFLNLHTRTRLFLYTFFLPRPSRSRSWRDAGYSTSSALSEIGVQLSIKVEHAYIGSRTAGGYRWTKREGAKRTRNRHPSGREGELSLTRKWLNHWADVTARYENAVIREGHRTTCVILADALFALPQKKKKNVAHLVLINFFLSLSRIYFMITQKIHSR